MAANGRFVPGGLRRSAVARFRPVEASTCIVKESCVKILKVKSSSHLNKKNTGTALWRAVKPYGTAGAEWNRRTHAVLLSYDTDHSKLKVQNLLCIFFLEIVDPACACRSGGSYLLVLSTGRSAIQSYRFGVTGLLGSRLVFSGRYMAAPWSEKKKHLN